MLVKFQDIFLRSVRFFLTIILMQSYVVSGASKTYERSEKLIVDQSKDFPVADTVQHVPVLLKKTKISATRNAKKSGLDVPSELDRVLKKRRDQIVLPSHVTKDSEEKEYHYESSDASEQDFRSRSNETPAVKPEGSVKTKQLKDIDEMLKRFEDLQKQAQTELDKSYRLEAIIRKAFAAKTVSTIPVKLKSIKDVLLSLSPLIFNIELKKTWFKKQGDVVDASKVDTFINLLLAREAELKDLCKRWDSDFVQLQHNSYASKPENEQHFDSGSDTAKQHVTSAEKHENSSGDHGEKSMLNVKEDLDEIKGKLDEIIGKFDEVKVKLSM